VTKCLLFLVALASVAIVLPSAAQQPDRVEPTRDRPMRFSAVAVDMSEGTTGAVNVVIERWTSNEERAALLSVLGQGGQPKLFTALRRVRPRAGYLQHRGGVAFPLRYTSHEVLPDGTRKIVVAADAPVHFVAEPRNRPSVKYPFTFVEMRLGTDGKGEGRMIASNFIAINNGRFELEAGGVEPVRLTTITEHHGSKD